MKASDVGSSIFLMASGGFVAWQAYKLSIGSLRVPGPGFLPFFLGLLLIGLAVIILVQGIKEKPAAPKTGLSKTKVILALVAIFVYSLVLESLGYLLSTFLLMILLLRIMEKKAWWFAPTVGGLICLVSYFLFKVLLGLLLPPGLLGF